MLFRCRFDSPARALASGLRLYFRTLALGFKGSKVRKAGRFGVYSLRFQLDGHGSTSIPQSSESQPTRRNPGPRTQTTGFLGPNTINSIVLGP